MVGAIVGALIAVILVVLIILFAIRRRNTAAKPRSSVSNMSRRGTADPATEIARANVAISSPITQVANCITYSAKLQVCDMAKHADVRCQLNLIVGSRRDAGCRCDDAAKVRDEQPADAVPQRDFSRARTRIAW